MCGLLKVASDFALVFYNNNNFTTNTEFHRAYDTLSGQYRGIKHIKQDIKADICQFKSHMYCGLYYIFYMQTHVRLITQRQVMIFKNI